MLVVDFKGAELFDETAMKFIDLPPARLEFEHSLISLSKWEARWNVPFLSKDMKSSEQTFDYIKNMCLTRNVDPQVFLALSSENLRVINDYIDAPMTATTFISRRPSGVGPIITSEIIYYWMITFNIPFECQKWHLKRLMTLIRVCDEKNAPKKKMSRRDVLAQNRELNAARRAQLNTTG